MKMRSLLVLAKLAACYAYDAWRFAAAAHLSGDAFKTRESARAHLLRVSHSLEKGMALPTPKPGFGKEKTRGLIVDIERYLTENTPDEISAMVLGIVAVTLEFHRKNGIKWPELESRLVGLQNLQRRQDVALTEPVGTERITREEIQNAAPADPAAFFTLRRSVRQFSSEPISKAEIENAVRMAQRAPSVCNRQAAKVYAYTDPRERSRVLAFQQGNAGFGEHASVVFIVTSDMSAFCKTGERNQGFVDGGLFAMSLALALHSMGLGSCMLNWSMGADKDLQMRRALRIPSSEVVVTLMVAGKLLPQFAVAASPRRPLRNVLIWGGDC